MAFTGLPRQIPKLSKLFGGSLDYLGCLRSFHPIMQTDQYKLTGNPNDILLDYSRLSKEARDELEKLNGDMQKYLFNDKPELLKMAILMAGYRQTEKQALFYLLRDSAHLGWAEDVITRVIQNLKNSGAICENLSAMQPFPMHARQMIASSLGNLLEQDMSNWLDASLTQLPSDATLSDLTAELINKLNYFSRFNSISTIIPPTPLHNLLQESYFRFNLQGLSREEAGNRGIIYAPGLFHSWGSDLAWVISQIQAGSNVKVVIPAGGLPEGIKYGSNWPGNEDKYTTYFKEIVVMLKAGYTLHKTDNGRRLIFKPDGLDYGQLLKIDEAIDTNTWEYGDILTPSQSELEFFEKELLSFMADANKSSYKFDYVKNHIKRITPVYNNIPDIDLKGTTETGETIHFSQNEQGTWFLRMGIGGRQEVVDFDLLNELRLRHAKAEEDYWDEEEETEEQKQDQSAAATDTGTKVETSKKPFITILALETGKQVMLFNQAGSNDYYMFRKGVWHQAEIAESNFSKVAESEEVHIPAEIIWTELSEDRNNELYQDLNSARNPEQNPLNSDKIIDVADFFKTKPDPTDGF